MVDAWRCQNFKAALEKEFFGTKVHKRLWEENRFSKTFQLGRLFLL